MAMGLPVAGSLAMAASLAGVGLVVAAVAAVAAQVTEYTRGAYGISVAAVGVAFVLRAAGDVGDGTLAWLSPIGWGQATRPFAGERWWPLTLSAAAAGLLVSLAFVLGSRRDLGAGLVPPRAGSPVAGAGLLHPAGLVLRLQRGSLLAWSAGAVLIGVAYGSVGGDIDDLVDGNRGVTDWIAQAGGTDLTDSFLAMAALILALVGSGFALQSALRLRGEECTGRAEPALAGAVARWRWVASHSP